MSERQIFSKILRLDKYIYNDLLNLNGALQKGIAIYLAVATLTTLSAFRSVSYTHLTLPTMS